MATCLGQAIGCYGPDQNADFIGAIVGAVLILLVWGLLSVVAEPDGNSPSVGRVFSMSALGH